MVRRLLNKIKGKLVGHEYIKIRDIKIKPSFKNVNPQKMQIKRDYYKKYGYYKEAVFIDKYNYLIDGYTTYLLAIENDEEEMFVVRFTNETN